MSAFKWEKLLDLPGSHRYFRDLRTNRIGVADRSGPTPDQTDDGVLWLDASRAIVVGNNLRASIPLLDESGRQVWTGDRIDNVLLVAPLPSDAPTCE
jgi:hypothetical protein